MNKLTDYNTCPKCRRGELKYLGNVDMCTVCKHTVQVPSTTELWLHNLEVGETIYIKGMSFTKIQLTTGQYMWEDDKHGAYYSVKNLLRTHGTAVEVRCAS